MGNEVFVHEVETASELLLERVNVLLGQLSSSAHSFTMDDLKALVAAADSHLLVAECDGVVAGMLTLGCYLAPTGRKIWIEDVVVDEAMRGRSIGRLLVDHAVEYARSLGGGTLMLTSRPSREAANALYRSCGFELKETNNYRMKL